MGPMLTIEKAEVSSDFTQLIILLLFGAIILTSSTKVLTTGPSEPALVTKILWSALIRLNPSLSRRRLDSLSYQRRGDCLRSYKTFKSLHTMLRFVADSVPLGISTYTS